MDTSGGRMDDLGVQAVMAEKRRDTAQ